MPFPDTSYIRRCARSALAAVFLISAAAHTPVFAAASDKEELDLGASPDFFAKPAAPARDAKSEGIKAGVMAVRKEAEKEAANEAVAKPAAKPSGKESPLPVASGAAKAMPQEKVKAEPAPAAQDRLNKKLDQADALHAAGKFEDAIRLWEEALEIAPDRADIKKNIMDAEAQIEVMSAREVRAAQPRQAEAAPVVARKVYQPTAQELRLSASVAPRAVRSAITDRLSLSDCIDIAVKNHIPLQVAEKSVKLAKMRVTEARRNMLPTATIAVDQYRGKVNGRYYTGRKQYIEGQQPLFHGGELYYTVKQAEVNQEITRNEYAKVKNELILQVKKGYYTLAKSKDNLGLQRELAANVDTIYAMVQRQAEANIISKLEVLNVASQKSQVAYQLASAEGDVSVAELILKQAMSVDPEMDLDIVTNLRFRKILVDYAGALAAAYMNRPEMKINTLMLEYYKYGKRIAGAKGSLKVDLMGNWGLAKEEYATPDNGPIGFDPVTGDPAYDPDQKLEQQWYAGFKASYPFWGSTAEYSYTREQWVPVVSAYQGTEAATNSFKFKLFDRLDTFSDNQLADIDFDRARQELVKMRQDVTLEVKEQCFNYQKALIQLETATNKIKFQERDLEFTKMKRGLDEIPDSNVIESMIKMAQEKFGYVQALADCHISVASINKAIGIQDYFKDEAR